MMTEQRKAELKARLVEGARRQAEHAAALGQAAQAVPAGAADVLDTGAQGDQAQAARLASK